MTDQELEFISWIEQQWMISGEFPNIHQFQPTPTNNTPPNGDATELDAPDTDPPVGDAVGDAVDNPVGSNTFDPIQALHNPSVKRALEVRGIPHKAHSPEALTAEQVTAISVICNINDKRSRAQKFKELGITQAKWSNWMRSAKFKKFFEEVSQKFLEDNLDIAHHGLLHAAGKGNVDAIKLYMDMTGRSTKETQELQNMKRVLAQVVESIQYHIQDPDTVEKIAEDFDAILKGEPTRQPPAQQSTQGKFLPSSGR